MADSTLCEFALCFLVCWLPCLTALLSSVRLYKYMEDWAKTPAVWFAMTVVRLGDIYQRVVTQTWVQGRGPPVGAGLDARGYSVQGYQTFLMECRVDVPAADFWLIWKLGRCVFVLDRRGNCENFSADNLQYGISFVLGCFMPNDGLNVLEP